MRNETCPNEPLVLAARRSGQWDADLSKHLEHCAICTQLSEVSDCICSLGSLPDESPLPDPDLLWMRAAISAGENAAAAALRRWMLAQLLRYGLLCAGVAWFLLGSMNAEGPVFDASVQGFASPFVDPVGNAAISALAALATALVTAGLVVGGPIVAKRLRYVGLL